MNNTNDTKVTTKNGSLVKTIGGYEISVLSLAWSGFWIGILIAFILIRHPRHIPTILVVLGATGLLIIEPINAVWRYPYYRIAFGVFLVFPGLYAIATAGLRVSVALIILGGAFILGTEMTALLRDD
ncbi:hypothetical protein [Halocatena salina]|uniref:Uncharacterized protein n=1 Tax=Halocatena salina TaxID=2934340 RepID=A0A8U0A948_9EURY|nr:hypothetical protein [Halocatena salina]UPM45356.1 hypothetical protein MW046_18975 [Halocatena salina]